MDGLELRCSVQCWDLSFGAVGVWQQFGKPFLLCTMVSCKMGVITSVSYFVLNHIWGKNRRRHSANMQELLIRQTSVEVYHSTDGALFLAFCRPRFSPCKQTYKSLQLFPDLTQVCGQAGMTACFSSITF